MERRLRLDPVNVLDCGLTNSFISCQLFKADYSRGEPEKIMCGNFAAPLLAGQTLKLTFSMINPPLSSLFQIWTASPVFVNTYDLYLFSKPNYNTVTVGTHLKNSNTNSTLHVPSRPETTRKTCQARL
jgi:hypothetical protein